MATHSPQSGVVASRVNEIVGRLRERGHRLTPQRYAFVRALVEGGEHPSAYSAEIATDSEANRHSLRRKSAVREVGAKRRWEFCS
jgi:hypothetical protein